MRVFPYLFCKKSEKKRKKSSKKKWPFLAFFKKFPYINLDFGPFLGGLKKAQLTFYSKRRYTYLCPGSVGYTFVFDLVSYGVLKFHLLMRSTFNFLSGVDWFLAITHRPSALRVSYIVYVEDKLQNFTYRPLFKYGILHTARSVQNTVPKMRSIFFRGGAV